MTQDEARARVAKGAAHLDRVRPGWFNRIDTGTLALRDPCGCIIGQLGDGMYRRGFVELNITSVVPFGFDLPWGGPDNPSNFQLLQDAWIEAIADRLLPTSDGVPSQLSTGVRDTGAVPQFRG